MTASLLNPKDGKPFRLDCRLNFAVLGYNSGGKAFGCSAERMDGDNGDQSGLFQRDDLPMEQVSWYEALLVGMGHAASSTELSVSREDCSAWREELPAWREELPARREERAARREEFPTWREEFPARKKELPVQREDYSTQSGNCSVWTLPFFCPEALVLWIHLKVQALWVFRHRRYFGNLGNGNIGFFYGFIFPESLFQFVADRKNHNLLAAEAVLKPTGVWNNLNYSIFLSPFNSCSFSVI